MRPMRRAGAIRPPTVAGMFYPGDSRGLASKVTDLVAGAAATPRPGVRAIIAPHAGYSYSGPVAGEAFAALGADADRFRRAVVIGPSHFVPVAGLAAASHAAFATPLGEIPVDEEAVDTLAAEGLATIEDRPHARDHALEVELPFIQTLFGSLPIVPVLFGAVSASAVAAALARLWDPETLLVISSDLSHYESYEAARDHDRRTAAAIERFDEEAIGAADACGHMAIRGMLVEARRRGYAVERLDLRSSGDTAADRTSVVGYGAWVVTEAA